MDMRVRGTEGILGNGDTRTEAQEQTGTDDILELGNSAV